MHDRHTFKTEGFPAHAALSHLREMSAEEFAELGADNVVFVRPITAGELAVFIPEAQMAPEDSEFHMLMSAGGAPVLVTDNHAAITDWLDDKDVTLVQRH